MALFSESEAHDLTDTVRFTNKCNLVEGNQSLESTEPLTLKKDSLFQSARTSRRYKDNTAKIC